MISAHHVETFWSRVDKSTSSPCWAWAGSRYPRGYGRFHIGQRAFRAHRVAYEISNGPIPDGLLIDHICHNRLCVNPEHLRLATNKQNLENIGVVRSSSGYLGVTWHRRLHRWQAAVTSNGVKHHVGYFDNAADAGRAAAEARVRLFTHNALDRYLTQPIPEAT